MGFLEALRRIIGNPQATAGIAAVRAPITDDLGEDATVAENHPNPAIGSLSFDREQWRRKLRRAVEHYPASKAEFAIINADALSLGIDADWANACRHEEFSWMVRRAVADRVVTLAEHSRLDEARHLLGVSEADATAILQGIVAEAETVFDGNLEGV